MPMPPADLEIWAQSLTVSKMPSIESSDDGQQEARGDVRPRLVPALNMVGVAWVKTPRDIIL